jgi:hypothetical protein
MAIVFRDSNTIVPCHFSPYLPFLAVQSIQLEHQRLDARDRGPIPGLGKGFHLLAHRPIPASAWPSAYWIMCELACGGKAAEAWSRPLTSNWCQGWEQVELHLLSPLLSGCAREQFYPHFYLHSFVSLILYEHSAYTHFHPTQLFRLGPHIVIHSGNSNSWDASMSPR